jgi:hypothetical protein
MRIELPNRGYPVSNKPLAHSQPAVLGVGTTTTPTPDNDATVVRATSTPGVAPTAGEVATPVSGMVGAIILSDGTVEYWTYTTAWALGRTVKPSVNAVRKLSASGAISLADRYVLVDASGGSVTLTLPAMATVLTGTTPAIVIKRIDASANVVTVNAAPGAVERVGVTPIAFAASTAIPPAWGIALACDTLTNRWHIV